MSNSRSTRRATISDVATRAQVSIATVSRVINRNTPVAPATAQRVHAAIAELDFTPHAAARGLAGRKTNTLGLLLPAIGGSYFSAMLRGIENCASQNSMALLVYSMQVASNQGDRFSFPLGAHNTDGMIIFTDSLDDSDLIRLHERQFPMVLLHQTPPPDIDIPYVTVENKAGARKLIDHLIEVHGRRHIAYLSGPKEHEDSYWREMGYREALATHNISVDTALMATGNFSETKAHIAVEHLVASGVEIDAIFAGDDEAAIGTITALRQAGKRIPEDVAVVGFDDLPQSRHLTPPLTTVRAPIEQVGQEAVTQLIRLIKGKPAESQIILPTKLVIRKSCGC